MDDDLDDYHEAAFVNILLECDECPAALESDELVGVPTYPAHGWDIALGNEAKRLGWQIERRGGEFLTLCPTCRGKPRRS
jgi:hypothetical protein